MAGKFGGFGHFDLPSMNFSHDLDPGIKLAKRGISAFLLIWIINILIGLGLLGLVVYVAWHFISKAW